MAFSGSGPIGHHYHFFINIWNSLLNLDVDSYSLHSFKSHSEVSSQLLPNANSLELVRVSVRVRVRIRAKVAVRIRVRARVRLALGTN